MMKLTPSQHAVLKALPGTNSEIARKSGHPRTTVQGAIRVLRDKELVYVCGETSPPHGGVAHPIYAAGQGADEMMAREQRPLESYEELINKRKRQIDRHIAKLAGRTPTWFLGANA